MGLEGPAVVEDIEPCPHIEDGPGHVRAAFGLFEGNEATHVVMHVVMARLKTLEGFIMRAALPGPMTPQGALTVPELLFDALPRLGADIEIIGISLL